MRIGHQKIMIADPRNSAASMSASMNVHIFTKHVVMTDREKGVFTFEFEILRLKPDCSKRIELIVLANCGRPFHDNVRLKPAAVSDLDAIADPAIWPNHHIVSDFSFRAHDGSLVNHG